MSATFKPTPPAFGRDWLRNGYGIRRCICSRCVPPSTHRHQLRSTYPPRVPQITPALRPAVGLARCRAMGSLGD
jgi:hypothetical protein